MRCFAIFTFYQTALFGDYVVGTHYMHGKDHKCIHSFSRKVLKEDISREN